MNGYSRCLIGLLPAVYECDYDWVNVIILFDDIRDIYILGQYLSKWKKALPFTQNYTSQMAWFLKLAWLHMHKEQQCEESSGDVAILWTQRAEATWQEHSGRSSCLKGMQYYHKFKEISVKWECSPVEKWILAILFFQREDKGGVSGQSAGISQMAEPRP